jgi:Lrp/AsnC family transcriptional regulator for asnA, asnC and gidA
MADADEGDPRAERAAVHEAEDDVDRALIAALEEDGRMTSLALSRRVAISETSVRQRLKRLFATGTIRAAVVADMRAVGLGHVTLVRMSVAPAGLRRVLQRITALPQFAFVVGTTGAYDVTCFAITVGPEELTEILDLHFRTDPAIGEINVRPTVAAHKFDPTSASVILDSILPGDRSNFSRIDSI